jgi:diguanylate cyclase (GGDEF)-like protein/putative nucleotidyltransferase with HDIG domain
MEKQQLPSKAVVLIGLVVFLGALGLGLAAVGWESPDLVKFLGFLTVALFAVGTRLAIPGPAGNLPLTFVFVLMGVLDLSSSETVVLAAIVAISQCYWQPAQKPHPLQVAFNVGTMVLAAGAAVALYDFSSGVIGAVSPLIRFAVATAIFCVLHTAPVAGAVAFSEDLPFFATWRDCYFWTMPYYLAGGIAALLFSLVSRYVGWQTVLLSGPLIYLVYRSYSLHVSRLQNQKKHAEDVSALHLRTIQALALAIEAKDHTTHDHLARVQVYARELARELKLSPPDQEALLAASVLHDIGKLAVPEHIISKPGRLSPEEFEKMKIHPTVGAEILEQVQFPYPVAPIVRAHHERWDGAGYPAGLKGEEIPIGARILAVVDCLDALASDRQYRRALPLDEAMKVVERDSGKAFDPKVVEVLQRRYVELERMAKTEGASEVRLSTEVKVDRGDAPAAGFEATAASPSSAKDAPVDYVGLIAAARQEVQTLFEITQELGNSLSIDDTMSMLAVRLRPMVPHHSMAIWVRRENTLTPAFVLGDDFRLFSSLEIPMGQGLSGWVAENHKPIVNGNPSVESGYLADPTRFSTLRSAIAVPLEGLNGVSGVLALYHADRDAFSKEHLRLLLAISGKIGISIENALRFKQAEASVSTDMLTGIANAREVFLQLDRELSRARRESLPVTAVVMDLDGFKQINDRFGLIEGNRVLRSFALGLKGVCREYDTVARMGGDEFLVLLPGARPEEIANRVAQYRNVLASICRDRFAADLLTISMGIASFPPDGADAEALLAQADRRMYAEKSAHHRQTLVLTTRASAGPEPMPSLAVH